MPAEKFIYDHPRPAVTVDIVVLSREDQARLLLIRRKHEPYQGCWALPGGFINMDETLEEAARRELMEETGVEAKELLQMHTFGALGRDPRGRTISVVYLTEVDASKVSPHAADDASEADWFALDHPPELAFDHQDIIASVRRYVRERHG